MRTIIHLVKWELSSIMRLRILLPLVVFMFFASSVGWRISMGSSSFVDANIHLEDLASNLRYTSVSILEGIYMALAFFSIILVSTGFAGELDSGNLKYYLSLPVSRFEVFISKLLANYLLLFLMGLAAVYYQMILITPEGLLILLRLSIIHFLDSGLFLMQELLFTFSVSLYFSIVSRKAWQASLYSILMLYSFYMVPEIEPKLSWFVPPSVFAMFWNTYYLYYTFFSLVLLCLSSYLFVRRLQVS